jgi:uncharacterized protein (TIGR00730 family)
MNYVCVYCGSARGNRIEYADSAAATGKMIASHGCGLVYGGGHVGLMGVIADAVMAASGPVIGVITQDLMDREVGHTGITDLRIVTTMHERKTMMADVASCFIVLPGGIGTFEEFFEIWTWALLGDHKKPIGLINVAGYYDGLISFIEHSVQEGFLKQKYRDLLIIGNDPADVLKRVLTSCNLHSA